MGTTTIPPPASDDKRDICDPMIDVFVRDEQALLEHLATLTADRDAYRELAQQAIHQLHDAHRQYQQLQAAHARVLDEYQHLRVQLMTKG